jgi:hypothetical protein
MCEKIDWNAFMRRYNVSSVAKRVQLIASYLKHFDTQPNWVANKVWGLALGCKGEIK